MKKYFVLLVVGFAVIGLIIYSKYVDVQLDKHAKYTVGKIYKISPTPDIGFLLDFKYRINNRTFKDISSTYKSVDTSKFYLIQYNYKRPSRAAIFLDKIVNIKNASEIPSEGWDSIPEHLLK